MHNFIAQATGNMSDLTKWAFGLVATLISFAVIAVWRLIAGKADTAEMEKNILDLRAEAKAHADEENKKFDLLQAEGLRQYRELRTAIEVIQKELTLLDKHSLTNQDLIEMKADIKEVIAGQREQVKLMDSMPDRLTSLEATRNKQSEK